MRSSLSERRSCSAPSWPSFASSASTIFCFTSFARPPTTGRSSAGSPPRPRRIAFRRALAPEVADADRLELLSRAAAGDVRERLLLERCELGAQRLRRGGDASPRNARDLRERLRVVESERGEYLPVDLDAGGPQSRDEPAVGQGRSRARPRLCA
jgi:hypothetical protein